MQRYSPTIHEYPDQVAKAAMVEDTDRGDYYHRADVDAQITEITENCTQINNGHQQRIAELEEALEAGRVAMRDLWRLEPGTIPSDELALRCKAFMGGG